LIKPTERLIITQHQWPGSGEQSEQDVITRAQVEALFPDAIVSFPEEVAGLEYDCVVLHHPLGKSGDNIDFRPANQALKIHQEKQHGKTPKSIVPHSIKHATTVQDPRFSKDFQTLYMCITRARDCAVAIQEQTALNDTLLAQWAPAFDGTSASVTHEHEKEQSSDLAAINNLSTEAEWRERIIGMHSSDNVNLQQVKKLIEQHLYQDLPEDQRYQIFTQSQKAIQLEAKKSLEKQDIGNEIEEASESKDADTATVLIEHDLNGIFEKLNKNKQFLECTSKWAKCLTADEKKFLLSPEAIYMLAEKGASNRTACMIISRVFIYEQALITPSFEKIKNSVYVTKVLLTALVTNPEAKQSDFYKVCIATGFKLLTDLVDLFTALKNRDDFHDDAIRDVNSISGLITQGLLEKPEGSETLLSQLHQKQHQPIFLQLIKIGAPGFDDNKTLMPYLKSWKIEKGEEEFSDLWNLLQGDVGLCILGEIIAINPDLIGRVFFSKTINYFLKKVNEDPLFILSIIPTYLNTKAIIFPIILGLDLSKKTHLIFLQRTIQSISLSLPTPAKMLTHPLSHAQVDDQKEFFMRLTEVLVKQEVALPLRDGEVVSFVRAIYEHTNKCAPEFKQVLLKFTEKVIDELDPINVSQAAFGVAIDFIQYLSGESDIADRSIDDVEVNTEISLRLFVFTVDYFQKRGWAEPALYFPWEKMLSLLEKGVLDLSDNAYYSHLNNKFVCASNKLIQNLINSNPNTSDEIFLWFCQIMERVTQIRINYCALLSFGEQNAWLRIQDIAEKRCLDVQTSTTIELSQKKQLFLQEKSKEALNSYSKMLHRERFSDLSLVEGKHFIAGSLSLIISLSFIGNMKHDGFYTLSLFDGTNSAATCLLRVTNCLDRNVVEIVGHIEEENWPNLLALFETLGDQYNQMAQTIKAAFPQKEKEEALPPVATNVEQHASLPVISNDQANNILRSLDMSDTSFKLMFAATKSMNGSLDGVYGAISDVLLLNNSHIIKVANQFKKTQDDISGFIQFTIDYSTNGLNINRFCEICIKTNFEFLNVFLDIIAEIKEETTVENIRYRISLQLEKNIGNFDSLFSKLHEYQHHSVLLKLFKFGCKPTINPGYLGSWRIVDGHESESPLWQLLQTADGLSTINYMIIIYGEAFEARFVDSCVDYFQKILAIPPRQLPLHNINLFENHMIPISFIKKLTSDNMQGFAILAETLCLFNGQISENETFKPGQADIAINCNKIILALCCKADEISKVAITEKLTFGFMSEINRLILLIALNLAERIAQVSTSEVLKTNELCIKIFSRVAPKTLQDAERIYNVIKQNHHFLKKTSGYPGFSSSDSLKILQRMYAISNASGVLAVSVAFYKLCRKEIFLNSLEPPMGQWVRYTQIWLTFFGEIELCIKNNTPTDELLHLLLECSQNNALIDIDNNNSELNSVKNELIRVCYNVVPSLLTHIVSMEPQESGALLLVGKLIECVYNIRITNAILGNFGEDKLIAEFSGLISGPLKQADSENVGALEESLANITELHAKLHCKVESSLPVLADNPSAFHSGPSALDDTSTISLTASLDAELA
jgi:hypothetical protein